MTAHIPASINLSDPAGNSAEQDQRVLLAVVDQLNVVTQRLHELESQIAKGSVIITEPTPITPARAPLSAVTNNTSSGWQPAP